MIQGKYRVWCNVSKRYYRPDEEIFIDQQGKVFWAPGDGDWLNITYQFDVEFFTGLHDKNGKEIYGGDILKWVAMGYPTDGRTQIVTEWDLAGFDIPYEYEADKVWEVIGNRHENPELLTGGEDVADGE